MTCHIEAQDPSQSEHNGQRSRHCGEAHQNMAWLVVAFGLWAAAR